MQCPPRYSGYKRGLSVRINAIFCCALFGVQINSMFYAYFGTVAIRLGSIPFQENLLVGHGLRVLKNVTQYSQFELLSLSRIVEHYVLIKKQFVTFSENLDRCTGSFYLLNKPMQIFNLDETGVSIVYKPGKVIK